jgi:hypothetical protein
MVGLTYIITPHTSRRDIDSFGGLNTNMHFCSSGIVPIHMLFMVYLDRL